MVKGEKFVLVIGVVGGVGFVVMVIFVNFGYNVVVVIGCVEVSDYLIFLGVIQIVVCEELNEIIKCLLESENWVGCVDVVGGDMLVCVFGQVCYGVFVVVVGFVGGVGFLVIVIFFLLCGVNFLGIDFVMQFYGNCLVVWQCIVSDFLMDKFEVMINLVIFIDLLFFGVDILKGQVCGCVVVDVNV